jgi:hypothetical protein
VGALFEPPPLFRGCGWVVGMAARGTGWRKAPWLIPFLISHGLAFLFLFCFNFECCVLCVRAACSDLRGVLGWQACAAVPSDHFFSSFGRPLNKKTVVFFFCFQSTSRLQLLLPLPLPSTFLRIHSFFLFCSFPASFFRAVQWPLSGEEKIRPFPSRVRSVCLARLGGRGGRRERGGVEAFMDRPLVCVPWAGVQPSAFGYHRRGVAVTYHFFPLTWM